MKKRISKKKDKMVRNGIHNLLDIVLDINGISKRQKSLSGNLPTTFFDFAGHVGEINISIYDNGWFPYADADYRSIVKTNIAALSKECKGLRKGYRNGRRK